MIVLFLFLASVIATCHGSADYAITNHIYPLRMKTSSSVGDYTPDIPCSSWRLGVEVHNIIDWKTVPKECENYVSNYMLGGQYRLDSKAVAEEAYQYASSLNISKDENNIWIFDVDETTLSNLPYYAKNGFGAEPFNNTAFREWSSLGEAPALPETLKLYKRLLKLGIKIVILTGRREDKRNATATNLKSVGYTSWEKLILKGQAFKGTTFSFKSGQRKELEENGYRIVGNMGDQWGDILGASPGNRTFKLPDPMYYVV
ncbi:hypothetical protein RIF29_28897 [Crotalaria pallida]|uniref:Acid phosphatase n=1 Tax=Crotalaria pallida TaxID=3830 RepID=A0AAN9EDS9_CROPI